MKFDIHFRWTTPIKGKHCDHGLTFTVESSSFQIVSHVPSRPSGLKGSGRSRGLVHCNRTSEVKSYFEITSTNWRRISSMMTNVASARVCTLIAEGCGFQNLEFFKRFLKAWRPVSENCLLHVTGVENESEKQFWPRKLYVFTVHTADAFLWRYVPTSRYGPKRAVWTGSELLQELASKGETDCQACVVSRSSLSRLLKRLYRNSSEADATKGLRIDLHRLCTAFWLVSSILFQAQSKITKTYPHTCIALHFFTIDFMY